MKRAARTSVSKSTSVMSTASVSVLRNLIAADARQLDVLPHAAAGVEQQAQVQRRRGLEVVAGGEIGHRLRRSVLPHLEVLARQRRLYPRAADADGDADGDQVGPGAKYRLLRRGRRHRGQRPLV